MFNGKFRIIFCVIFLCEILAHHNSYAQNIAVTENENYLYEVKQIEDFIDRFNNSPDSYFIKYFNDKYKNKKLTREALIRMMTNYKGMKAGGIDTLKKFVACAANPKMPYFLNFYGSDWYAQLDCKFESKGKPVNILLTLELQVDSLYASEWVISGIKADMLSIPLERDSTRFINPASNGTDFLALDKIFADKQNLVSYFYHNFKPSSLTLFIDALRKGTLKFVQVNDITYYFFQVKGWEMEVKYFNNPTSKISGWLISKLNMLSDEDKDYFIYKTLGRQ